MHVDHCCLKNVPLTSNLDAYISVPRMKTYLAETFEDLGLARDLYLWNRDLSAAFLADIAILEVSMRNAMHTALVNEWGAQWYQDGPALDQRSSDQLSKAWDRIPRTQRENLTTNRAVAGRLVANCMFGFWTNLLDQGGPTGLKPPRDEANYEQTWQRALRKAFKGARSEAKAAPGGKFDRQWVHAQVKEVNDLRNRVAHHESLVKGFPLIGQSERRTAAEGHEACLRVARMLDRNLAAWLANNSQVPRLLSARPSVENRHPDSPCARE